MNNKLILFFFLLASCKTIDNLHGVDNLKIKVKDFTVKVTNENDVLTLLGSNNLVSSSNKKIWLYSETRHTRTILGKSLITQNDIVRLEFDDLGILAAIDFLDKNDLKKFQFDKEITSSLAKQKDFISNFLASMRLRSKNISDKASER